MNYKESAIAGTKHTRSYRVEIDNPFSGEVTAIFHEEEVAVLSDGSVFTTTLGSVSERMTSPAEQFTLLNPETFEPTEVSMTYGEAYVMLLSLYLHLAQKRDAEIIA